MNLDDFPLSVFEVDCDGTSCGSRPPGPHIHPPQDRSVPAVARVVVRDWKRVRYEAAEGITRLVVA